MPLEPQALAILCSIAFLTAVLSAVVGMAGGIILLSFMLLYLEPLAAIPLHGAIQLLSNGSRAFIQRRHVEWGITWRYALLLLPLGWAGLQLALAMPPDLTRLVIGLFVLAATWRPAWLLFGAHPEQVDPRRRFLVLGGVAGVLNVTIGAVGPLIAPFFLNLGLERQGIVGTKAACQAFGHVAKIFLYGLVGFAFADYALPLVLMGALVIAGTWTGSRLLERVSERGFTVLFKTALTLVALRLVLLDGWRWLSQLGA